MTKINKLGKSTFAIAILAFLLVAILAFGGTYAYFSDAAGAVDGTVTMGNLHVSHISGTADTALAAQQTRLAIDGTIAQPNQTILNDTFKVDVTGNISYYTRVKFTVTVDVEDGHAHEAGTETECNDYFANAIDALEITATNSGWEASDTTAATGAESSKYYYKLAPTTRTAESTSAATESFAVTVKAKALLGNYNGTAEGCEYWMDADVTISITFEVLQADYLTASEGAGVVGQPFTTGALAEAAWEAALATGGAADAE